MPNWVYNTLTIQGPKEQVDFIKDKLNTPYQKSFENWNMESQQMEFKDYLFPNPVFAFHNIHNHLQDGISDEEYLKQPNHKLGDPITFEGNDWYNWNVRNWGTKWDVAVSHDEKYPETELIEYKSEGEDNWVVYRFNTAWSPPAPAMEKLSALVPNCVVTLDFEEETGWGGEYEFVKGEMTAESNYESKCRDCDAEDTLEYCDTCAIDVCLECHDMNEANPNDVAECEEHREYAKVD